MGATWDVEIMLGLDLRALASFISACNGGTGGSHRIFNLSASNGVLGAFGAGDAIVRGLLW